MSRKNKGMTLTNKRTLDEEEAAIADVAPHKISKTSDDPSVSLGQAQAAEFARITPKSAGVQTPITTIVVPNAMAPRTAKVTTRENMNRAEIAFGPNMAKYWTSLTGPTASKFCDRNIAIVYAPPASRNLKQLGSYKEGASVDAFGVMAAINLGNPVVFKGGIMKGFGHLSDFDKKDGPSARKFFMVVGLGPFEPEDEEDIFRVVDNRPFKQASYKSRATHVVMTFKQFHELLFTQWFDIPDLQVDQKLAIYHLAFEAVQANHVADGWTMEGERGTKKYAIVDSTNRKIKRDHPEVRALALEMWLNWCAAEFHPDDGKDKDKTVKVSWRDGRCTTIKFTRNVFTQDRVENRDPPNFTREEIPSEKDWDDPSKEQKCIDYMAKQGFIYKGPRFCDASGKEMVLRADDEFPLGRGSLICFSTWLRGTSTLESEDGKKPAYCGAKPQFCWPIQLVEQRFTKTESNVTNFLLAGLQALTAEEEAMFAARAAANVRSADDMVDEEHPDQD